MKSVHFTFNNFFDYLNIAERLKVGVTWIFNPNEFIIIFPYTFTSKHVIYYIENLCKPLNIQFTTTIEVVEDIE